MTKTAYLIDIVVRSFFVFLVAFLSVRNWLWALLLTAVINLVFELTVGKKYWRQFKNAPKKPRRKLSVVLRQLWQRLFARERTKGFVWAGVVILFLSLVVRLNVYYVCCACVVFTLAAISRFAPPTKMVTPTPEPPPDTLPSPSKEKYPLE